MIPKTTERISSILTDAHIDFELLFVNDGSKDNSWKEICKEEKENWRVRAINFSRNFGKESAIFAGLTKAKGDCVVVIDCDLQHPPEKSLKCMIYGSRAMK